MVVPVICSEISTRVSRILLGAAAALDAPQDAGGPCGALAAGRALPARLVGVEVGHAAHLLDDVGRVVHYDHRRAAEHGPGGLDALVAERALAAVVGAHDRHRTAARDHRLEGAAPPGCHRRRPRSAPSSGTRGGTRSCRACSRGPRRRRAWCPGSSRCPHCRYHSPPWRTMCGVAARVSTLLIVEGIPKTPTAAGKGGFTRGSPRHPSRELMRPVSSPQM